jgi:hypothetical protein
MVKGIFNFVNLSFILILVLQERQICMRRSILNLRRIAAKLLISETTFLVSTVAKNELTFGDVAKGTYLVISYFLITLHAVAVNCMQRRSCFAIVLGELKLKFKNGG